MGNRESAQFGNDAQNSPFAGMDLTQAHSDSMSMNKKAVPHGPAGPLTGTTLPAAGGGNQTRVRESEDPMHARPPRGESQVYSITACEGSTVSDLCWLLGELPDHARLVDFASDTDVTLVFRTDTVAVDTNRG